MFIEFLFSLFIIKSEIEGHYPLCKTRAQGRIYLRCSLGTDQYKTGPPSQEPIGGANGEKI